MTKRPRTLVNPASRSPRWRGAKTECRGRRCSPGGSGRSHRFTALCAALRAQPRRRVPAR